MSIWEVAYTLDGWGESIIVRAHTEAEAAWKAALEMADRGFRERVLFITVYSAGKPKNGKTGTIVSEGNG